MFIQFYRNTGREEQVEAARKQLEAAVAEISNVSEGEMSVAPRHHRHFVARRGEVLRRIAEDCGGVQISFPRQGVNSDRVVLKGPKDCIEAAKVRINEIIEDLEAKVITIFISLMSSASEFARLIHSAVLT